MEACKSKEAACTSASEAQKAAVQLKKVTEEASHNAEELRRAHNEHDTLEAIACASDQRAVQ